MSESCIQRIEWNSRAWTKYGMSASDPVSRVNHKPESDIHPVKKAKPAHLVTANPSLFITYTFHYHMRRPLKVHHILSSCIIEMGF